jgi:hypothetical protein
MSDFCKNASDVALDGLDAVSYFEEGGPKLGSAEFSFRWNDATWQFATAAHRDLFSKSPDKYAPQFRGECAFAASFGGHAKGSPKAWKVVDGKLFFAANGVVRGILSTFPGRFAAALGKWKRASP